METITKKRLYEGMFLIDSALAASDWDGVLAAIKNVLERADAEIVCLRKWSERRLAYEIDHKARGAYILCYFRADSHRIQGIEKDVQLSENIMRVLILSTEDRPAEVIDKDIADPASQEKQAQKEQVAPSKPQSTQQSDSDSQPENSAEKKGQAESIQAPEAPVAVEPPGAESPESEPADASDKSSDETVPG